MATELASAYLTLIPSLKGAQKQIEAQLSGIDMSKSGKSMGGSLASGFGAAFKTVAKAGVGAVGAIGAAVGGLALGGGISRALKLDQAAFKFEALGMDAQSAMESCSEAVSGTAFGLDAAATVATKLGASGVEAGDAMTGALKSVAGVAAMTGRSMEDIGSIFGKVAAKGKVTGDELLQLNEAGINATAALAKSLGKSNEEIQRMVSKGQIDFATFSAAMQETFGEAASGANETFQGAMSNVMAALSRVGAKFASPALGELRRVFVALIPAIDAVSRLLDPAVGAFAAFAEKVASGAVASINAFTDALAAGKGSLGAFKDLLAEAFDGFAQGGLFRGFASRLQGFAALWKLGNSPAESFVLVMKNVQNTIREFGEFLGSGLASLVEGTPLEAVFGNLAARMGGFATLWKMGETPLESFRLVLANAVNTFSWFGDIASSAMSSASQGVSSSVEYLKGKISELPQPLQGVIGKVSEFASWVSEKFGGLSASVGISAGSFALIMARFAGPIGSAAGAFAKIGPAIGGVVSSLAGLASAFMTAGGGLGGITALLGAFVSPVGLVAAAIAALASGFIALMITNEDFRSTVAALAASIGASLMPIVGIVSQALQNLAATVLPLVSSMIQMLLPVIGKIVVVVLQVVAALAPFVTMLVAKLVPTITTIVQLIVQVATAALALVLPAVSAILGAIMSSMPAIQEIITTVMSVVLSTIEASWTTVQAIIEAAMIATRCVIDAVWPVIESVINTAMAAIAGIIGIAMSAIRGDWEGAWNGIKNLFGDIWRGIQDGAKTGVDAVVKIVTGIKDSVIGFFSGAGSWLVDAGSAILHGLWDGISGALGWLGDQLAGIGDFIIQHKGPKAYDLRMLIPNGTWIMESLGTGLEKGLPGIRRTLAGITAEVSGWSAEVRPYDAVPSAGSTMRYSLDGDIARRGSTVNNYYTIEGIDVTGDANGEAAVMALLDYVRSARGMV